MRRLVYVVGALALAAGCDVESRNASEASSEQTEPEAPEDPPAGDLPPASPDPEEEGHIGTVVARESVDIPSSIEGIIAEVKVGIGDEVEEGDPIAEIDDRPIREQLMMAEASARAAAAQRRRAAADLAEAKRRYQRREALSDQIAAEELETARFAADRARAARSEATAALAEHRANVEKLKRKLEETTVTAPFSGTVSVRYVDSGAHVARGAPVVRLLASGELWVRFAVPAEEAGGYSVGERADVELGADGPELQAEIRQIAPDLDPVTQMVLIEGELLLDAGERDSVQPGAAVRVFPRAGERALD